MEPATPATTNGTNTCSKKRIRSTNDIDSSPITTKLAAYGVFSAIPVDLKTIHAKLVDESSGHYVGPIPVRSFFDVFMPWNDKVPESYKSLRPPHSRIAALKSIASVDKKESYDKFVRTIEFGHYIAILPDGSHPFRLMPSKNGPRIKPSTWTVVWTSRTTTTIVIRTARRLALISQAILLLLFLEWLSKRWILRMLKPG